MKRRCLAIAGVFVIAALAGCSASAKHEQASTSRRPTSSAGFSAESTSAARTPSSNAAAAAAPARPTHVVVVMEENHSYRDILNAHAPYLHSLIAHGTSMTKYFAIRHPSEPNYLALFSGSTQGLTNDSCPHSYGAANLASELRAAHRSFVGYSEGLPKAGYLGCTLGKYARRHVPWTNFRNLPAGVSQPFTKFPHDYARLPTVSFVIPNLDHDMHDGTIAQADTWLHERLGGYASWARTHNSALIVTWDEDDKSEHNQVPTIVYGARVRHASYGVRADHYTLLRTLQWLFGLKPLAHSVDRKPITSIWGR